MLLSICIATFNRAGFIGETLDSITPQLRPGVEVVVVDGASGDDTRAVVEAYAARFPAIRYIRETQNSGVDADYDKAVGYAAGRHCWLFTDDDTLVPGAVDAVVSALEGGAVDLLIVDAEVRDASLTRTLRPRRLRFTGVRTYGPGDGDAFLRDAGYVLTFIGATVVRRELWMGRQREPYYGSLFVHVGVILQAPAIDRLKILGQSLVRIRLGNAMWKPRSFEIWGFKWPDLIWGFDGYGAAAKKAVTPREPWRSPAWLFAYRALGAYSLPEYRAYLAARKIDPWRGVRWAIALFPGPLANLIAIGLLALIGRRGSEVSYDLAVSSRFSNPIGRWLAGLRSGPNPPA